MGVPTMILLESTSVPRISGNSQMNHKVGAMKYAPS